MADTAAFFAKKKKGGKKFKSFNANKIDISKLTTTVHIDAPAVSTGVEKLSISNNNISDNNDLVKQVSPDNNSSNNGVTSAESGGDKSNSIDTKDNDAWEDMQISGGGNRNNYRSSKGTNTVELLDMKALESKRREQDDVAERMRVEETKAKLAAAREGMEKEAQRLKEEKDGKTAKKVVSSTSNRFGAAAANLESSKSSSGGSAKWVPSRRNVVGIGGGMRSDSMVNTQNNSSDGTGYQRKVDTDDQELFPDLATADKILAKEEEMYKQQQKRITAKKKSTKTMGWGAKKTPNAPSVVNPPKPKPVVETKPTPPPATAPTPTPAPAAVSTTPTSPTPAAPVLKKKKKKKKDLSTFKASS